MMLEEPVTCVKCGAWHELQQSRFCKHYGGLCRNCYLGHRDECVRRLPAEDLLDKIR